MTSPNDSVTAAVQSQAIGYLINKRARLTLSTLDPLVSFSLTSEVRFLPARLSTSIESTVEARDLPLSQPYIVQSRIVPHIAMC